MPDVRPPRHDSLLFMASPFRRPSTVLLVLLAAVLPANADEPSLFAGVRATCDVLVPAQALGSCPGAELFGRFFVTPHVSIDVGLGYRSVSISQSTGRYSSSSDLRQYPVLVGASYLFAPGASVRPVLSGGVIVAPYKSSYSLFLYPGPAKSGSDSSVAVGGFGSAGLQFRLGPAWYLDASLRYVYNPVTQPEAPPDHENYVAATLGLAHAF